MDYTASTGPYLQAVYACSRAYILDSQLSSADHLELKYTDLAMRIGAAADLTTPSFHIGTDSIEVIVNASNPLTQPSLEQVTALFTGRILNWKDTQGPDEPVEVWVFSSGEDVEQLFEQAALQGAPVTSMARLAVTPEAMAAAVARDANAIGILTKSWKADGIKSVFSVAEEPVLIYTATEPQGAVRAIIDCLQR